MTPVELRAMYRDPHKDPVAVAKAVHEFMKDRTFDQAALETGITAGTLNQLNKIIAVCQKQLIQLWDEGKIGFKIIRAIKNIEHIEMMDAVQPFLDGRLTSVHVEEFVQLSKLRKDLTVDELVPFVKGGYMGKQAATGAETPIPAQAEKKPTVDPDAVRETALRLAGQVEMLGMQEVPEYQRLGVVNALNILDRRIEAFA